MKVKRTEQMWINDNKDIGRLCHISKNLYNEASYTIRQEFFKTGKWIRYNSLCQILKHSENYKNLPSHTGQQILRQVDQSWKSFFNANKEWKDHPEKFLARPKIPKYKPKKGRYMLIFTYMQAKLRNGKLIFPKKIGLEFKTRIDKGLKQVRIIPKAVGYVVEIIYEKMIYPAKRNSNRITGLDVGVRNTITMANNFGEQPIVVKGGVGKSINNFFNKEKARIQKVYDSQEIKNGKRIRKLTIKRERKLNDWLHKVSRFVVNWCLKHSIETIIIGQNKNWKQKVEMGRRNNQSFIEIPFHKLIHQIAYKGEENGIAVTTVNEAFTSICSFLDNETIERKEKYVGRRKRGLFRTARGKVINADVNAAYNIMKKAVPNAFAKVEADGIEDVELHPVRCKIDSIT